jgi:hypothetical protein
VKDLVEEDCLVVKETTAMSILDPEKIMDSTCVSWMDSWWPKRSIFYKPVASSTSSGHEVFGGGFGGGHKTVGLLFTALWAG